MPKNPPELSIATEKVCFIVVKAREFDVKDVVTDPDDASNASDDYYAPFHQYRPISAIL